MIELKNITKNFDDLAAVSDVSLTIKDKTVFGLIGTNGAGKSTTLRMIAGVYKPDCGEVLIDDMKVFNNVEAKERLFFISDDPYFAPGSNADDMEGFYSTYYKSFDRELFIKYTDAFGIERSRKIDTFSKGMKKQLAVILGLCARTKYLLCDETFDGLDPVMRQAVKTLFAQEIEDRGLTVIIASHNLRELEDICDHIGLLHKGGVLLSKDLIDMKCNIQKIQCVLKNEDDMDRIEKGLNVIVKEKRGSLYTLTIRSTQEEAVGFFKNVDTVFCEVLPLSLEEIFISETEVNGYDIRKIIMG